MQAHEDFVFHLDEPHEQFSAGRKPLRGWVATREPLPELRLRGESERPLRKEERPDVRRAFPNFSCATGFADEVGAADFHHNELRFSFSLSGGTRTVVEILAPPPAPPAWIPRLGMRLRRGWARRRLRAASGTEERWRAALSLLLLEVEMERGTNFRRGEADRVLALFAEIFPEAFVVQIGANDGRSGDPLREAFTKSRWSGLLVEPVPHLFEQLRARYQDRDGVKVERAAISVRDGDAILYRLRSVPGETPEWFDQLATLNRDVLLKHRASIPEIDSLVIEERIRTVRLETLFRQHEIERIDLFVIDTEGHDYEILRDFAFERFRPSLIMFEHQHLSPGDKTKAYALMRQHGYTCRETPEGDAIAWRA